MKKTESKSKNKNHRGSSAQFFVAAELCRRELVAVVTMGNCPNTDILCSDVEGKKFAHIQVKAFVPGKKTCTDGLKAEKDYQENFFWVLAGIPFADSEKDFIYYIIPAKEMAKHIKASHDIWLKTPGAKGQAHNPTTMRNVALPPHANLNGWNIDQYKNRWDLIESRLR